MKKKILSVLLAAILLLSLMPTAVFATESTNYGLYIGGVQVTENNKGDLVTAINNAVGATVATGSASYTPATEDEPATLVLNNFNYKGNGYEYDVWYDCNYYAAIYTLEDLNIILQGENSIACMPTEEDYSIAVYCEATLTVSGNSTGALKISDVDDGVFAYYVTIEDAILEVSSIFCGIYGEDIIIDNSEVKIKCEEEGIYVWEDITIIDSIVDVLAEDCALNCAPTFVGEHKVYTGFAVGMYEYTEDKADDWVYKTYHVLIVKGEVDVYPLWIGEEQFTENNLTFSDGNGGTATYTPATEDAPATLTLNNFNLSGEGVLSTGLERWRAYSLITSTEEELNIVLKGENSVICTGTGDEYSDFYAITGWNITFLGSGGNDSLTVSGGSLGIDALSVTVENCTLEAVGGLCAIADIWSGPIVSNLKGSYVVYAGTADDHPVADATDPLTYDNLYIKFVPTYTVTYVVDDEVVHTEVVEQGKDATAPEIPAKEGYDKTAPKWDNDGKSISSDITITAVYTKNEPGKYKDATPESNVGGGKLTEAIETLKEKIPFTSEEKGQIEFGADVEIWLEVKDASDSVSNTDKEEIEKMLGDSSGALYLDISVFKKIGDNEASRLSQLNDKVQISIKLDDNYINTDENVTRTYSIIHVHNGTAEIITPEFDEASKTLTFMTDRFSTYALVYSDEVTTPPTDVPETGDNSQPVFWGLCMSLSLLAAAALLLCAKRTHLMQR